ncbi:hypothetical protein ABZ410_15400 [Streptomyces cinnamoneus]|uniref:hypothetical protein n=1 Tax=Streptomyces cinnamoneus TaxID=53446 RepID=UPI0033E44D90
MGVVNSITGGTVTGAVIQGGNMVFTTTAPSTTSAPTATTATRPIKAPDGTVILPPPHGERIAALLEHLKLVPDLAAEAETYAVQLRGH